MLHLQLGGLVEVMIGLPMMMNRIAWVDGCWMVAACDWVICRANMSKMPQSTLGELFRMVLNSAEMLLIQLDALVGFLGVWWDNLGEGGL